MDYLWLKALHVACVLLFVGGLFVIALTLAGLETPRSEGRVAALQRLRVWDRWVTVPSLVALWIFGIVMAIEAGLFSTGWLSAKLLIVLALSGLHGALSSNLRKAAVDPARAVPGYVRYAPAAIAVCVVVIAILVVTKLF